LAGMAIFPAVFAYGIQPDAGPSLLFITIPNVFASMPFGHVFMVLFFLLTSLAAVGAMLSLIEVPVAFIAEHYHKTRKQATLLVVSLLAALGSLAALSNSILAQAKIFGLTFFDLFDFVSSNVLLPVGGFFIVLFVGWVIGWNKVEKALSNNGSLKNQKLIRVYFNLVRFVTPIFVLIVLLNGFGIFKFN